MHCGRVSSRQHVLFIFIYRVLKRLLLEAMLKAMTCDGITFSRANINLLFINIRRMLLHSMSCFSVIHCGRALEIDFIHKTAAWSRYGPLSEPCKTGPITWEVCVYSLTYII